MKIDILHMSDAEMEIVRLLWRLNKPVTIAEISLALPHKQWKPTTIHTLLNRLVDKGIVKYFQTDGKNYYLPYITEFDYKFIVSKTYVNMMFNGDLADMLCILLCDQELTGEVLSRLREEVNTAVLPSSIIQDSTQTDAEEECNDNMAEQPGLKTLSSGGVIYLLARTRNKSCILRRAYLNCMDNSRPEYCNSA